MPKKGKFGSSIKFESTDEKNSFKNSRLKRPISPSNQQSPFETNQDGP